MQKTGANKLKILCLHGFNNNVETFKFMTEGVRAMMRDIADFFFVDGSYTIDENLLKPEPGLMERGFKGPFKAWLEPILKPNQTQLELLSEYKKRKPLQQTDGGGEYRLSKNSRKSVDAIVQASKEFGPFDGVLSFSQGSAMFRVLYLHTQLLHRADYSDFVFPQFLLSFSGAVFKEYIIHIDDRLHGPTDHFIKGVDSMHFHGVQDPLLEKCRINPSLYIDSQNTQKIVIEHQEGHKVLKKFTFEQFQATKDFMRNQYFKKFGSDKSFVLHESAPSKGKL